MDFTQWKKAIEQHWPTRLGHQHVPHNSNETTWGHKHVPDKLISNHYPVGLGHWFKPQLTLPCQIGSLTGAYTHSAGSNWDIDTSLNDTRISRIRSSTQASTYSDQSDWDVNMSHPTPTNFFMFFIFGKEREIKRRKQKGKICNIRDGICKMIWDHVLTRWLARTNV